MHFNDRSGPSKKYSDILLNHVQDFSSLFSRVEFSLDADTPTEKTAPLYLQYGRYLLISCSRPGTQPANLQGIWNQDIRPAWNCNYTTNINVEMNYWGAETLNLSECHEPLFDMLQELAVTGADTAKKDTAAEDGAPATTAISGEKQHPPEEAANGLSGRSAVPGCVHISGNIIRLPATKIFLKKCSPC